ncbi:two-component system sensor histidine kinase DesK [Arthrobacter stackebrandtii]|uniref:Two-component system sensor histidine kinase DesK n=1 Tax=Arthrobacter stackebrandtii TaxID=272161 RepID=A0ABS4YVM5_9MICC|nr:histidine kinase [Arthrobacter stackebrandtii]MBP2412467.1 two-component system sensor histidine kinase DesK [Arthrobacter stackebrandtii]PYH02225.1 histidine kinase [Arthrobacter stackebrandtii]
MPTPEIPQPHAALGRNVRTTWTYTLGSIVFILIVLDATLLSIAVESFNAMHDAVSGLLILFLLAAVATQVRYAWFLRVGLGGGLPAVGWTLALLVPAAAVWVLGLFLPSGALVWTVPVWLGVCLLACLLPRRPRWAVLGAGLASALLFALLYGVVHGASVLVPDNPGTLMLVVYAAGMPPMLLSALWFWRVVVELDRSRLLGVELAVAQERLRFAADLHDIQGHHLQVIALKSELAERLLPVNPDAALANIRETRLIAKQALEETRTLVSGYRETSLGDELENAREVLAAAGADCELVLGSVPADPATHKALAMTVREATTNILRHSDATAAAITLAAAPGAPGSPGATVLTISNNGVQSPHSGSGTGLLGLRERIEALGGTLETTLDNGRFELQARVPGSPIPQ